MNYFLVRFCKIYGASFRSMIERIALCRDYALLRSVSVGNVTAFASLGSLALAIYYKI
ncbi:hypothetical protein FH589_06125 [Leptospira interrogans]|uniref:hypothetical protein n=1 Tax=Leptospira interrogans TaxID=173 RepID=UPI0012B59BC3|nr:hypothetical protein [Leptospira interrogans]ULG79002.1 hypothetical protein FH595_09210 [Leptospira interrogans]ULG92546.1 hypothetical protein FH584_00950 [Leptospira interrogans]UML69728.1 hypothetical protein FH589_06125 [Leptospira interrogans]UML73048.1 hypothetical protein FH598_04355 [Leptospira interrogans]